MRKKIKKPKRYHKHRHWHHPILFSVIAAAAIGGLGYAAHSAIDDYHDRIALRGFNGKPRPVSLTIAAERMVIPANMIRFRSGRRGGDRDKVDLILHWPTLEGYSNERANDFRGAEPDAPVVYLTVAPREDLLAPRTRLEEIYSQFFVDPSFQGPEGLIGRHLSPQSGYPGETVYYAPSTLGDFVARCETEETPEIPSTCIRDIPVGQGLTLIYRFNRNYLTDWRSMDSRIHRLVAQFFRKA